MSVIYFNLDRCHDGYACLSVVDFFRGTPAIGRLASCCLLPLPSSNIMRISLADRSRLAPTSCYDRSVFVMKTWSFAPVFDVTGSSSPICSLHLPHFALSGRPLFRLYGGR